MTFGIIEAGVENGKFDLVAGFAATLPRINFPRVASNATPAATFNSVGALDIRLPVQPRVEGFVLDFPPNVCPFYNLRFYPPRRPLYLAPPLQPLGLHYSPRPRACALTPLSVVCDPTCEHHIQSSRVRSHTHTRTHTTAVHQHHGRQHLHCSGAGGHQAAPESA